MRNLTVNSQANCYELAGNTWANLEKTAQSTKLEPGLYAIRINKGTFSFWGYGDIKEPFVMLWLHGGLFTNLATDVRTTASMMSLNGYNDTVTIRVERTTTLFSFFMDAHKGDNRGDVVVSIIDAQKHVVTLEALGKEKGKYLSHAHDKVWLQNGVQGEGETFILEQTQNGVALACTGGEKGKYLSHAFGKLFLQDGLRGQGEEWIYHDKGDGNVAFECLGKEKGLFLSHAFAKMWLQKGYQGEGELWKQRDA